MSEYQKCPVCDGHGYVSYPPGTPPGVSFPSTSTGPWPCHRCSGSGTILTPQQEVSGILPPFKIGGVPTSDSK